jgi:hypothetical protein
MNYYFFPQIDGFKSSITLVNYPCQDHFPLRTEIQKIYTTWSDGNKWHYRAIDTIAPHEAKEIHLDDLPADVPRECSPFLFFHYKEVPEQSDTLILSEHMFFMPTWRGNIKVYNDNTGTSYEGDYQHEMVRFIKKGSMCSLSPMFQSGPDIINKFIMTNLKETPEVESHIVRFVDPYHDRILAEKTVFSNRCNTVDLDDVQIPSDTVVLAVCGTLAGIPVFFSAGRDGKTMSFEHTHPPASMVVFGKPTHFQKELKSYWLEKYAA